MGKWFGRAIVLLVAGMGVGAYWFSEQLGAKEQEIQCIRDLWIPKALFTHLSHMSRCTKSY